MSKRTGKVFIDVNQNVRAKTLAAIFSPRAVPEGSVSTPLRWDEVTEDLDPRDFTMEVVLARVDRDGDLFEGVLNGKQSLSAALKTLR